MVEGVYELPAYVDGAPVPIISWVDDRGPAATVLLGVVTELLTDDLRHWKGMAYAVDAGTVPLSPRLGLTAVWTDSAVRDQSLVITQAVNLLRHLASDGPDVVDLDHQKAVARNRMTDPRATVGFLMDAARRHLEGRAPVGIEELVREIESVTAEQVRAAATAALPTLLLGGTIHRREGIVGVPDRTDDIPECPAFDGRRWRRRVISRAPRDLRLDVNGDGLALTVFGERHGGRWSDVVGVAKGPDFRDVVFRDGTQVTVWPGHLRDGGSAAAEIDQRAGDLLFDVDDDWLEPD